MAGLLREPESARRLGEAARAHVTRAYGWAATAAAFEAAYDKAGR
jgi:hypothetical protein